MTPNDKLPEDVKTQINKDACGAVNKQDEHLRNGSKDYGRRISFLDGYEAGYIAGATAYAPWKVKYNELQMQAQAMADALEDAKYYVRRSLSNDDEQHVREAQQDLDKIVAILQQFKDGKEVEDDK